MEWLNQLKEQFLKLWGNFNTQTKLILGTLGFALILALIFLVNWAGTPEYAVLYFDLTAKEASSVSTWLDDNNVPYKLEAGGSRISVPRDKKSQILIDIAGAGISPSAGSVGFELFDQSKLGMTEDEQRIRYIRAISGEMERAIEMINGVELAVVKVSLPEPSLFLEEEKPAKASVLLKLSPGARLSQKNVNAITQLIAAGVDGLLPEHVTVVDANGNMLTQPFDSTDQFGLTTSQLEYQREYEKTIQTNLYNVLGRIYGPQNVVVSVAVDMNFDRKEILEHTYSPVVGDEGIVRSSQIYEEDYTGSSDAAAGVPGATSNIPEYTGETGTNTNSELNKSDSVINYELNEKQVQQTVASNNVNSINVSVVVNREDFTPEDQQTLQNFVATTVGYDPERGDQLMVLGMPFDNSAEQEYLEALALRRREETRQLIIYGVAGLLGLILIWIIARRFRGGSSTSTGRGGRVNTVVGDAESELAATMVHELSPEEKARRQIRKELADLISKKPEDVANLLKTWLMDD